MNVTVENQAPFKGGSRDPHSRRIMHVAPSEDVAVGIAITVGENHPRTGATVTTGVLETHKQAYTHSVQDLRDVDDIDEGKIVSGSPPSMSPKGSGAATPSGPPSVSLSWRNFLLVRGWLPEFSFKDALPKVALTMALNALICAVIILGRKSTSRGGR